MTTKSQSIGIGRFRTNQQHTEPLRSRRASLSPNARQTSYIFNGDYENPIKRRSSLIIRRNSVQISPSSNSDRHNHTRPASIAFYPQQDHVFSTDKSIDDTLAFTPPANAVSILIGGNRTNVVGSYGDVRVVRDSSQHIYKPAIRSRSRDFFVRFTPNPTVQSDIRIHKRPVLPVQTITAPISPQIPVSIAVSLNSGAKPPIFHKVSQTRLKKTTSLTTPHTSVYISASTGGGVLISPQTQKSNHTSVSLITIRDKSEGLYPSGSCSDLHSHNVEFISTKRLNESPDYVPIQLESDMPNEPQTDQLGFARVNCVPTIHDRRNNLQAAGVNIAMAGNPIRSHTDGAISIAGISPVVVPIVDKCVPYPRDNLNRARRSDNIMMNQSYYNRVQLPCTRATSGKPGFCVTDSLKLYEEQIFSHCDPSQRPQSWCIDMDPIPDDLPHIDDINSTSPASTVSSSCSSSSSSDASQLPYNRRFRPVNTESKRPVLKTSSVQPRFPRFPVNLEFSEKPNASVIEDATTPTSTQTNIKREQIGFEIHSEPQSPQHFQKIHPQQQRNTAERASKGSDPMIMQHSMDRTGIRSTFETDTASTHPSSGHGTFPTGFETVRPTNISNMRSNSDSGPSEYRRPDSQELLLNNNDEYGSFGSVSSSHSPSISLADHTDVAINSPVPILSSSAIHPQSISAQHTYSTSSHQDNNSLHSNLSSILPPPAPWNDIGVRPSKEDSLPSLFTENEYDTDCSNLVYPLRNRPQATKCRLAESEFVDLDDEQEDRHLLESAHSAEQPYEKQVLYNSSELGQINSAISPFPSAYSSLFESTSDSTSCVSRDSTYAFSTLDSEYLAWMHLSVRDTTDKDSNKQTSQLTVDALENFPRVQVHHWVDVFNSNPMGLRLNFVDDSCRLAGTLRIHINLIKPVKMSLRQTMDMLPDHLSPTNGPYQRDGENKDSGDNVPSPARLISFFLPRGTSKVVYITSSTTATNAVQSLLDRFHIQESARKFALYEHTLESNTIISRKLSPKECPLLVLLNWARVGSRREDLVQLIQRKRIVLQENDACEIDWREFTAAELVNFLQILDKEEAEYRNAIVYQYGRVKNEVANLMKSFEREHCNSGFQKYPYSRVGMRQHPLAFPQTGTDELDNNQHLENNRGVSNSCH